MLPYMLLICVLSLSSCALHVDKIPSFENSSATCCSSYYSDVDAFSKSQNRKNNLQCECDESSQKFKISVDLEKNSSTAISNSHIQLKVNTVHNVSGNSLAESAGTKGKVYFNSTLYEEPRRYFCTVGEPFNSNNSSRFKRYVLQGSKWDKLTLTWAVVLPSRKSDVVNFAERELEKALAVWSKSSKLSFLRVRSDDSNIDIKVEFHTYKHTDNYPFDGEGGTLAHAFYPGEGVGGDIHFDDSENFVRHSELKNSPKSVSFFVTAAHEIGHSLGLSHSKEKNSLMYPLYNKYEEDFVLPYDDKIGIQSLYGYKESYTSNPITIRTTATPRYVPRIPTRPPTFRPRPTPRPTTPFRPRTRPRPTPRTTRYPTRPPRPRPRPTPRTTRYPIRTSRPRPTSKPQKPKPRPPPRTTPYPSRPSWTTPTPPITNVPITPSLPCITEPHEASERENDICSGKFDASVKIRGLIMFFKKEYIWYFYYHSQRKEVKKTSIVSMFPDLETYKIRKVDAAYTLHNDKGIVFFVGSKVYNYTIGSRHSPSFVKRSQLEDLGVTTAKHLDAAWRWVHNGHVYLLSGEQYWRLNSGGKVQEDYPRDSGVWRGLPKNISAALTHKGKTYFFSENAYWEFEDLKMRVKNPPADTASFWFSCPFPEVAERVQCSG